MYDNALRFKALGDPVRLALLHLISRHNGQLSVFELVDALNDEVDGNYSQPTISHHLAILQRTGYIEARKHSLYKYYHLTSGAFLPVLDAITRLSQSARMEVMV